MLRPLFEAVLPSLKRAVGQGPESPTDLQDTIRERLNMAYHKAANRALRDLHKGTGRDAPPFHLQARWKQKAIDQQAKAMAQSLASTVAKERQRLEGLGLPPAEVTSRTSTYLQYKTRQLSDIIDAEAAMQAQVDQLVHAGIVDPARDRIMYLAGPHTCPWCTMIHAGNPWTVEQATNYGAKIHPNCRDHWQQQWQVDDATMQEAKRRIRDGTVRAWTGTGQTPGPQSAKKGAEITRRFSSDWREQKRRAQRDARRKGLDDAVDATLTRKQLRGRERRQRSKARADERALRDYTKL